MTKAARRKSARGTPLAAGLTEHWEKLAAAASVLTAATTAVVYAVTLNANTVFAEVLGVTPDDLGVTQTGLIASALMYAVVLGLLGALVTASLGLGWALTFLVGRHTLARWPVLKRARVPWPADGFRGLGLVGWLRLLAHVAVRLPLVLAPPFAAMFLLVGLVRLLDVGVGFVVVGVWISAALGCCAALYEALTYGPAARTERGADDGLSVHGRAALGLSALVVLTVLVYVVVDSLGASAISRAQDLLDGPAGRAGTSRFADPFLAGQRSAARLVPLTSADPLDLCDGKKVITLLSASGEDDLVIVYPARDKPAAGVYRVPRDVYGVVSGLDESVPCTHSSRP